MYPIGFEIDPIALTVLQNRLEGISEEMSIVLRRTAYSPNIKERADFSCAIFNYQGKMLAQAEAIPVHLGSMPFVAEPVINSFPHWKLGDAIVTNSPRSGFGGTHLPDITLLAPVFYEGKLTHVVANRAHHSDVGGMVPGSLPATSTEIYQEGLIIPPVRLYKAGTENNDVMDLIMENVRTPVERRGDLRAQYSSLLLGVRRLNELVDFHSASKIEVLQNDLLRRSELGTLARIKKLGAGSATFTDHLDNDGYDIDTPVKIQCTVSLPGDGTITFDFSGTDEERIGNCNAPLSVTTSACYYIVRLLTGRDVPSNSGCFQPVRVVTPKNSVVNPSANVATSSANTETSSRIVDVLIGAVNQIIPWPSASQGTMNNLIIGGVREGQVWSFYETIGGGVGAGPDHHGTSGIHSHMTNTENTPIEAMELSFPVRVREYSIRKNSGGSGKFSGGNGIIREIEVLSESTITFQTERRIFKPFGQGDQEITSGSNGQNLLFVKKYTKSDDNKLKNVLSSYKKNNNNYYIIGSRATIANASPNTRIRIKTPGGGGYLTDIKS
ncbi:MAG: hydantoinase B/oxoprolinase family protein [Candidatus Kariarchaeaceae archaeon]|jgi:N-methylhydantoinase B